jgi:hypothetical protein
MLVEMEPLPERTRRCGPKKQSSFQRREARVGIDGCNPQFPAILTPLFRAGQHESAGRPKPAFQYPFADSFTDTSGPAEMLVLRLRSSNVESQK